MGSPNGSAMKQHSAGAAGQQVQQQQPQLGPRGLIPRHEFVRLMEQALYRLGFAGVAQALEQASGIQMQPQQATQFQACLMAGDWGGALGLLPRLAPNEDVERDVRFIVLQQKYLEALEAGDSEGALACLRVELAPLAVHQPQLHHLAGLLLCPASPDLAQRAGWLGGSGTMHRAGVVARVQEALQAPGVLLPEARLEVLVEQALAAQISRFPFHNEAAGSSGLSLLSDYQAGADSLPSQCVQVLDAHSDEVWHVAFSHSGTMLASASKDKTVVLWSVRPLASCTSPTTTASSLSRTMPPSTPKPATTTTAPPPPQGFPPAPSASTSAPPPAFVDAMPFTAGPPAWGSIVDQVRQREQQRLVREQVHQLHQHQRQQQQQQQQQQQEEAAAAAAVAAQLRQRHGSHAGASSTAAASQPAPPSVPVLQGEGVLRGHEQPVAFVAWSPDDQMLLTVSDEVVRLWQVHTGRLLHTFLHHRDTVSCCVWMPDGQSFLSGSVDKTIVMSDTKGAELQRWKRTYRVQDMVVSHNGALLIIACSDRQIHILRLCDGREVALQEEVLITSISLSPDSRYLLAALHSHVLRLWHLDDLADRCTAGALGVADEEDDPMDTMVPSSSVAEYHVAGSQSKQPGRYVVRSAFGGANGSFVVHGSEDCQVYVWHRDSAELLLQLEGHSSTVNACAWSPTNPHLLVSASDDRTLRVWASEHALRQAGRGQRPH